MNEPVIVAPSFGQEPDGRPHVTILGAESDWDVRLRMPNTESFRQMLMRQGARTLGGGDPEFKLEDMVGTAGKLLDIIDLSVRTGRTDLFLQLLAHLESTIERAFHNYWPNYRHWKPGEFARCHVSFGEKGQRAYIYAGTRGHRDYRPLSIAGWSGHFVFSHKATAKLSEVRGACNEQTVRRGLKVCAAYYLGGFMRMMHDSDYKRVPYIFGSMEKALTAVAKAYGMPT